MNLKKICSKMILPVVAVISLETAALGFPFHTPAPPRGITPDRYCVQRTAFMLPSGEVVPEGAAYFVKEKGAGSYCHELIQEGDLPRYREIERRRQENLLTTDLCQRVYSKIPLDPGHEYKTLERLRKAGNDFLFK